MSGRGARSRKPRLVSPALGLLLGAIGCSGPSADAGEEVARGPLAVAVVGHQDLVATEDGSVVMPLVLGEAKLHLCVRVPADDLSAEWQLQLAGEAAPAGWREPSRRLIDVGGRQATVCFQEVFGETAEESPVELCGRLRRRQGDDARRLDCVRVVHRPASRDVSRTLDGLRASSDVELLLAGAGRASELGYPMTALQLRLGALHYLRQDRSAEAVAVEAARIFGATPGWLADHEAIAARWLGLVADMRGLLDLEAQRLEAAWQSFGEAERLYGSVADSLWPMVAFRRASVLERLGAYDEAHRLSAAALEICAAIARCTERAVRALRFQDAWLMIIDEDAAEPDLRRAKATFEALLESFEAGEQPLDEAEHLINIALADQRLGNDPGAGLGRASRLLAGALELPRRRQLLEGWIEIIAAQEAPSAATSSRCKALAEATRDPHLAALAFDCAGRAAHRAGDLDQAAESFERALEIWRFSSPLRLAQDISLGTGDRAATVYRAARLAIDRGTPATAWSLLRRLDVESAVEVRRRNCRASAVGRDAERWVALDNDGHQLLDELRRLERPAPGSEVELRAQRRLELRQALAELLRQMPGCESEIAPDQLHAGAHESGRDVRAFALDDEVVVLRRDGETVAAHRSAMARRDLRAVVNAIDGHLERRDLDDSAWRQVLAPVAAALVPALLATGKPFVTVALHGILQGVPLAALPLPEGEGWLGDVLTPMLLPAAVEPAAVRATSTRPRPPLIVVNPTGELRIETRYDRLIEGAHILERSAATHDAVGRAVVNAGWLHIDTHGYYDPAFAELSYLALADGRLGLGDVRAWDAELWFANLSGCETGRWPMTPDSGRYGIGGVFAAGRVGWVIASRAAISNRVAERFNQTFYRLLDRRVEDAYRDALAAVRQDGMPAVEWASLMLIAGTRAPADGGAR